MTTAPKAPRTSPSRAPGESPPVRLEIRRGVMGGAVMSPKVEVPSQTVTGEKLQGRVSSRRRIAPMRIGSTSGATFDAAGLVS